MTYNDALRFLSSLIDFERKPSKYDGGIYDPMKVGRMLDTLKVDYKKLKFIHIAGTNGKGSVALACSLIYSSLGYKTALYTSPHIIRVNERIKTGNIPIEDTDFAGIVEKCKNTVIQNKATYFETLTLIAIVYFVDTGCDIAVLETGLGGRLDATNFCIPIVSVITPVSFDHTHILGDTLEKIAREKAGIIKADVPVVLSVQDNEAMRVLCETALQKNAPLYKFADCVGYTIKSRDINGAVFDMKISVDNTTITAENIRIPQIGDIFVENFLLSILAVCVSGTKVKKSDIVKVSKMFYNPARSQIWKNTMIDISHNVSGLKSLFDTVARYINRDDICLYITALADKDIKSIGGVIKSDTGRFIRIIAFDFDTGIKTRPSAGYELFACLGNIPNTEYCGDISKIELSESKFHIFAGSFYSVAGILKIPYMKNHPLNSG
jgi:dihydrofolate synthase/folylpolyglutamate synthase